MITIYTSTHPRADVDISEERRRRKAGKAYWGNCTNQTRICFVAILPINITKEILGGVTTERVIVGKSDCEKTKTEFSREIEKQFHGRESLLNFRKKLSEQGRSREEPGHGLKKVIWGTKLKEY